MQTSTKNQLCTLCAPACGVEVTHQGREVLQIRGSQEDQLSKGFICPKAVAMKELDQDPDRIRTPLIKRHGKFQPASWQEAFALINTNFSRIIEQHGRDAIANYMGNPTAHNINNITFGAALLRAMGSKNNFSANTVDTMPKMLSSALMFGSVKSVAIPDIDHCNLLWVLGANPMVSNGSYMVAPGIGERFKKLRQRGGKIVVIDPVKTRTARIADQHYFLRPGTDAFLLLSVVHTLFEEKLIATGTLENHCNGIAEMQDISRDYSPESVAEQCSIPAIQIRQMTREFSAAKGAAIHARIGTCNQQFGTLASWLVDVIHVLTGNLDRKGGALFTLAAQGSPNSKGEDGIGREFKTGRYFSRVSRYPEVAGELPCAAMAEEIDTAGAGQVRGLLTFAGNPVLGAPDGKRVSAALDSLEFMVSIDIYVNETTQHADVILPGQSPFERAHYPFSSQTAVRNVARYSPALFDVPKDQLPEWKTLLRLAEIFSGKGAESDLKAAEDRYLLGMIKKEAFRVNSLIAGREPTEILDLLNASLDPCRKGPERIIDFILRTGPYGDGFGKNPEGLNLEKLIKHPQGIDFGPLQSRIPAMLRTATGKIELTPAIITKDLQRLSTHLKAKDDELILINRRQMNSNNSWMHNLPMLMKGKPRCTLLINPLDAKTSSLAEGNKVRVSSKQGSIEIDIELSDDIMPGVISIPHGWGHSVSDKNKIKLSVAANNPGVNCNELLDSRFLDVPSGNAALYGIPVKLTPI